LHWAENACPPDSPLTMVQTAAVCACSFICRTLWQTYRWVPPGVLHHLQGSCPASKSLGCVRGSRSTGQHGVDWPALLHCSVWTQHAWRMREHTNQWAGAYKDCALMDNLALCKQTDKQDAKWAHVGQVGKRQLQRHHAAILQTWLHVVLVHVMCWSSRRASWPSAAGGGIVVSMQDSCRRRCPAVAPVNRTIACNQLHCMARLLQLCNQWWQQTTGASMDWCAEQASTGAEQEEALSLQAWWQIAEQVGASVLLTQGWDLHISKGFQAFQSLQWHCPDAWVLGAAAVLKSVWPAGHCTWAGRRLCRSCSMYITWSSGLNSALLVWHRACKWPTCVLAA